MENDYNKIIDTLLNAIDCSTNPETEADIRMAIEIVKYHEENNRKRATKFEPILGDESMVLIDSGTDNYDQIRANYRAFYETQPVEKLKIWLEDTNLELKLQMHKNSCLKIKKTALEDRIKETWL